MWAWFAVASAATPYYDRHELRYRVDSEAELRSQLAKALRQRDLQLIVEDRTGVGTAVKVSSSRLRPLTAASVLAALGVGRVGAEFDTVVGAAPDGRLHLVTVRWDEGAITVVQNTVDGPLVRPEADPGALRERYRLGALDGVLAAWEPASLGVLAAGFERLTPAEQALLAGLPFVRRARTARVYEDDGTETDPAASYTGESGAGIEVYDGAVRPSARFVGTPWAPMHAACATLVHELGHALAYAARRDRALFVQAARNEADEAERRFVSLAGLDDAESRAARARLVDEQDRRNAAIRRVQALGTLDGVVQAWAAATGAESPTDYGRKSPDEGFAEAFALHRVDPEALARAAPRSFAWFEATDVAALVAAEQARVTAAVAGE